MTSNKFISIKTVSVIGANGSMGAQTAGIIAALGGAKVYMLARDLDKSHEGIEKAVRTLKTDAIRNNLIPCTYENGLEAAIKQSDWILETLAENYSVKEDFMGRISGFIRPDAVISTNSSGLSVGKLSKTLKHELRSRYFGTHFFNPPYKMILCELIFHKNSNPELMRSFGRYLEKVLLRKVVFVSDSPGFAANRIGFQLMNEVASLADKFKLSGGVELMDIIAGRYTGKAMPPLETLDLVGLDTYAAIVDNLYKNTNDAAHNTFRLPAYVTRLISDGYLGNKSKGGFYKKAEDGKNEHLVYNIKNRKYEPPAKIEIAFINRVKEELYFGKYTESINIIKKSKGWQADLLRYLISRYVSYSLSLVGSVVDSAATVDTVMAYGFNWIPPCAFIDLVGGKNEMIKMIRTCNLQVPEYLISTGKNRRFYQPGQSPDYRQYLRT